MHEMSLCEGILQTLEQQAKVQDYQKVRTVWLEIGALAGVFLLQPGPIRGLRSATQEAMLVFEFPTISWQIPANRA